MPGARGRPGIALALNRHSGPEGGLLQKGGGYFQVPDLVFDLDLTANEKLVLIYFMRRADRQGRSFPSVERICRDCGFGAQNTVRKAVKGLEQRGLLRVERKASRSNQFYVAGWLYGVIKASRGKSGSASRRHDDDEDALLHDSPPDNLTDFTVSETNLSYTPSKNEVPPSFNEASTLQNMKPKEYTVEGSSNKEDTVSLKEEAREKTERVHEEASASSSSDSRLDDDEVTMLDVAEHMDALSLAERMRFDAEALRLQRPGEPDPQGSEWQKRVLRVRHLRRLRGRGG